MKAIRPPKPRRGKNSLAHIQRLMLTAVRRPLTGDEDMQPVWSDGRETGAIAQTFIKPNDRLNAFERLQIYNQQYWWRLVGCLQEDFRGLRAVLGDAKFDALATAYLEAHPSRSWTMRNLGSHMPAFVEAHAEMVQPQVALALDVARVEWSRVVAFDDPAWPSLDAAALASGGADLKIRLQPYVQLLEIEHPVDNLMAKLKAREEQSGGNSAAHRSTRRTRRLSVARSRRPIYLAVHRLHFSLYYKRLEPEAFRLLTALRDGRPLEDACGAAFEGSKMADSRRGGKVRGWFSAWTQLGWLCRS